MKKISNSIIFLLICFSATSQSLNLDSLDQAIDAKQKSLLGTAFSFPELVTIDGERITETSLSEKVVIYNFWFTTCHPCVAEMPALNRLKSAYKNVVCIGLTFEPEKRLKSFLKEHPFDFKIVTLRRNELEKKISFGYPTTVIVNKKGKVAYISSGGPVDHEKAEEMVFKKIAPVIDKALAE